MIEIKENFRYFRKYDKNYILLSHLPFCEEKEDTRYEAHRQSMKKYMSNNLDVYRVNRKRYYDKQKLFKTELEYFNF